ncbi:nucleotidyltransferase family protein [Patescibacteria group bacterium]|nr:nucleotidyltransferase family protein [Patescibacteria group bacterium]MCG2702251.1 nucleotidyltransferase family protein [Candidatus Parcubacteria bacterium]MBU4264735.1 nucleotidyltransferase family protein [Patescibacteria group bacterium]MBU4390073.1 nucleotidyltransferase family protein [Patescibacteria group bacterium]MBU4397286.1 nucleotidyltransferase family protein [Patescibacteria group bacterium]
MTIQDISNKITPILKSQGALKAALFGSVVRKEAKNTSDIDLLVELEDGKSLLDLVRLQFALEDELGKKVDLLTYKSIHPLLRDIILKEQKVIYEKKTFQN